MNQETKSSLQRATQELRTLLEAEFSEQLSGAYDVLPDGTIADQPGQHLVDPKQRLIRRKVIEAIRHLIDGGKTAQEAVQDYIREASYTFLNRLVALRLMEAKKLLQPCVSKGEESSGFKEFCGLAPGLADTGDGYRLYLESIFDELSVEIKVLFNRRGAASWLWPRRNALSRVLAILEREELSEAWSADETIGWMYQGFNSEELEKAFREARLSGKKFEARDIPAVTQLFTQRWIVRYLVENTLGRLWVDMHPDSQIAKSFDYLVPLDGERTVPLKPVRDIRLLDPSCGTMHFGLVAFDLFVEMYREEISNAGKTGWPENASVASESEIASAILKHNLYGIDIDPRAVQLSALTLYLKAKTLNADVNLTETRLACADIHMLNGEHLGEFLAASGLKNRPIFERILKALQERLKDAEQLGSLLRLEEEIRELIAKERKYYNKEGAQPDLFGWSKKQFETEAGQKEFWETLEIQIGQALDAFAREQAEKGIDQSYFAGETTKGLRLLDVLSQRYDVVVTNPPYLSVRKMNPTLHRLINAEYKDCKLDVYAAFIRRCLELAGDDGRVGMLTMHSFMFIGSYESLRLRICNFGITETLLHAGPALFDVGNPGTLQTCAFVLRGEQRLGVRANTKGIYFRLVNEPDSSHKQRRFETALANLRQSKSDEIVFSVDAETRDVIKERPWVYWISEKVRVIFRSLKTLDEVAPAKSGAATSDNKRFLRTWWEVGMPRVRFDVESTQEAELSGCTWFPYMKGGGFKKWYGNQQWVVKFARDAAEMKEAVNIKRQKYSPNSKGALWSAWINSYEFYFRRGITYSYLTSSTFNARLSPGGFVFDVAGTSVFPDDELTVLGIMNSGFVDFALKVMNPTVNFQVGDLARLPVPATTSEQLRSLVSEAINLARCGSNEDETSWDFKCLPPWSLGLKVVNQRQSDILDLEKQLDEIVYGLYGLNSVDQEEISRQNINLAQTEEIEESESKISEEEDNEEAIEVEVDLAQLSQRWLSYAVGIVIGRFFPGIENALGRGDFSPEISKQLRDLADSDGVLVLDAGHPHDLAAKVHQALNLMLGENDARECIHEATGRDGDLNDELRRYFAGDFFKEHLQKYRKRPVYWLLQSPRKTYGVYLFHERITKDTLYRIRSDQYLGSKLKLLNIRLDGLQREAEGASGRELKTLQKSTEEAEAARDDLQAFASLIDNLIALGYEPNIDDGVLINMAPLWQLIPSWSAEPKRCWDKLVASDYDWSHTAMRLWPERVIPKCVENASYAIAHGLDTAFWTQDERDRFQPKPRPASGWKPLIDQLVAEKTRPGIKDAIEAISHSGAKPKTRSKKRGGQA